MSNQNRFLLPHSTTAASSTTASTTSRPDSTGQNPNSSSDQENSQLSVDTDFDSYWEEEARNPHRNRIRIGRQYQATVPPLLRPNEKDQRKLDDLETLSFCPKRSAKVSNAELDHYFTVAKSLNLFASLVETRSLLGRDVTIADLNHIRHKEGLSLASVIQPVRQTATTASYGNSNVSPVSSQTNNNNPTSSSSSSSGQQSPQKSPPTNCDRPSPSSSSPREALTSSENYAFNQPLMKALSHFISLHHPCHHDRDCKKLLKDIPLEDDSIPAVSITAGNLRQSSKESKSSRSRSSLKQLQPPLPPPPPLAIKSSEESDSSTNNSYKGQDSEHQESGDSVQSPSYDDWTREEVELFSKAIEVCGKNFSSIKKDFLPSKSVKSIVEYYYIGSRDVSDNKKKSSQNVETSDSCSSPEKSQAYNNSHGGGSDGGDGGSSLGSKNASSSNVTGSSGASSSSRSNSNNDTGNPSKTTLSDTNDGTKQADQDNSAINKTATSNSRQMKNCIEDSNGIKVKQPKTMDARMSVYNFDDEFKDDSPSRLECPRPGAEVRPLKAKPIVPNAAMDCEANNSNVGSLKFFMDGQLVLKLNACQEQQAGVEKCHWVESGEKVVTANRQKRYPKRANDRSSSQSVNGSQSNSVASSNPNDDSKTTIEDLGGDEDDSKESMNSFTNIASQQQKSFSPSPTATTPKRLKLRSESNSPHQASLSSPIDYNRLAVNNRMKERTNDNLTPSSMINQAAAMPWLQANSFAVAAALLGGLPFPPAANNLMANNQPPPPPPPLVQPQPPPPPSNVNAVNLASSKPMDLSLEHNSPKTIQSRPTNRSRSRPKNN